MQLIFLKVTNKEKFKKSKYNCNLKKTVIKNGFLCGPENNYQK